MIQDIFVPSTIGSYYVFKKRILGFEITTSCVQASLICFSKSAVSIENSIKIPLHDQNPTTISNAIRKIATTIGGYDEVVTSLTSSTVIFKELTLPFIGREKIKMIVNYEVEPLLPFSLDEAVIDFLITEESKEKGQSTVLVAATRQVDVDQYIHYFEKAGIALHRITLDMFALYDFYRHTMYVAQAHTSLLLIDFGIDAIRILYIQKGVLQSVRLVPYGVASMMKKIDTSLDTLPDTFLEDMVQHTEQEDKKYKMTEQLITDFCKQISLSMLFFQKQIKNFVMPSKIICLGAGTQLQGFADQATTKAEIPVEILDMKRVAVKNNIHVNKKIKMDAQQSASFIIPLSAGQDGQINFLSAEQKKVDNQLLNKQMLVTLILSLMILVGMYLYSNYQVQQWNKAYNRSRKEIVSLLKEQMDVDIKVSKRVADIVDAAQTKLQQTKKVCFSFSRSNNAFLNHLQELYNKIDRASLGLDLKKLSLHDKEIILQGKVPNFEALQLFEEELMELKSFTIKDKPRELAFTVTLLVKDELINN